MRILMMTFLLALSGANVGWAGHDDRYGHDRYGLDQVVRAARRLEQAAGHFCRQLKRDAGRDHAVRDAKRLARAARHFQRRVERGGSRRHFRDDYAELAGSFAHARREFAGRHDLHHDRHLGGDFRDVERAFRDLDRAMDYLEGGYFRQRNRDGHGWHHGRHDTGLNRIVESVSGS